MADIGNFLGRSQKLGGKRSMEDSALYIASIPLFERTDDTLIGFPINSTFLLQPSTLIFGFSFLQRCSSFTL